MSNPCRFVIIHSDGPMGSSSLAALLDYIGYTCLPIRKLKLEEYLAGIRPLNDPYIKLRVLAILDSHTKPSKSGGNSVLARNSSTAFVHSRLPDSSEQAFFLQYEPTSLSDLIYHCYRFAHRFFIYKSHISPSQHHLGYCLFSLPHPDPSINKSFLQNASLHPDIRLICMDRSFQPWLLSLLSQDFHSPLIRPGFLLNSFPSYAARLSVYSASLPANSLVLNISDILFPNSSHTLHQIASYLSTSHSTRSLPSHNAHIYDLFGRPSTFNHVFNPSPDPLIFLIPFIQLSLFVSRLRVFKKILTVITFSVPTSIAYVILRIHHALNPGSLS